MMNDDTLSGESLPLDLIEIILLRLPVKSLKQFRLVEKSWRSLIDSKEFAKRHLQRSLQTNSNHNIISGLFGFYSIGLESLDKAEPFDHVLEYDNSDVYAVSNSINGMVVVKREPEPPALWNPFTRAYKVLPECPIDFTGGPYVSCKTTYGFGYDSENDDYKVVKVMLYEMPSRLKLSEEWIYGLKSDCWRRTDSTYYGRGEWPIHVNGSLHSIRQYGSGLDDLKLIGFSVVTENCYEVPMPVIDLKGLANVSADVFDGCLALVCTYRHWFDIWVMEEYGVKKSWKLVLSFPVQSLPDEPDDPNIFVRPLAYSKERDKILLNYCAKGIAVCGLTTLNVKMFALPFVFWPGVCVETLISPNAWDKRNKDGEPKKKKLIKAKRDGFHQSDFMLLPYIGY